MFYDPLDDGKSYIKLVDFMGGDLAIVNDARTSFDRESVKLTEKDIKLINYLIKHKHYSPLRSTVFKFKVKAPLFICRQWFKHTVASSFTESQDSWNEKSFRYTDLSEDAEFYIP
ncbi:MAG: FAD-dependent thymidylate synthase, partial [Waterburya sp.]